jgi:GDSL-like lipase/acylhydrolase family protein
VHRIRTVAIQVVIGLVLIEICLRIYNPLPFRVRGDRIVVPAGQVYQFDNSRTRKLDRVTHHTTNSLGFRGPEPPRDLSRRLSVLTVGGSTTECLFLSDGKTWTDVLARRVAAVNSEAWVNNAGLDGQSTYGHLILLRDYIVDLHPKYVLFLIGTNDVERGSATTFDAALTPGQRGTAGAVVAFVAQHSDVAQVIQNLARSARAHRAGFGHSELDLATVRQVHFDESSIERVLAEHRERYLEGYRERVTALVDYCRDHDIEPVLITQPALLGDTRDRATGIDLAEVQVNGRGNGRLEWRLLELYNGVTRAVGAARHVLIIDLARELPKDSRLFYDFLHFTNEGAEQVGDIVAREFLPHVAQ